MSQTPSNDAIDRLNAWRDRSSDDAPPADVARQWEAIEGQLKKAFDPAGAQRFAFGQLKSVIEAEQAKERAQSTQKRSPFVRWASLIAASVMVGLLVVYLMTDKPRHLEVAYMVESPVSAYDRAVANGMKPAWTCTPEELPTRIAQHFKTDVPFALASIPADVQLLGWTGPYRTGRQVLDPNELLLLAKVDGQPVTLVIAMRDATKSNAPPPPSRSDIYVHSGERGPFKLIETSPFEQPRLLPLVRVQ
jgi:hypothetical protein